jgi:hypothetical protein
MNQRVLDRSGDILLGDWVDRLDNEQVDLEELLLTLEAEDQDQVQNDEVELDIERQALE